MKIHLSDLSQKRDLWIRIAAVVCLIINLGFIWGNSFADSQKSSEISDVVVEVVEDMMTTLGKPVSDTSEARSVLSYLVRKCAHFTEFFILSIWLTCLLYKRRDALCFMILSGLSTALIDETIQLFSDRTSSVADIWIDMFGFSCGTALAFFVIWLIHQLLIRHRGT